MEVQENFRVKRNLTALVEFSRIINASLDLNFILNNVLLTCMGKFLVTRGLVALKINNTFELKSSKGIPENLLNKFPKLSSKKNFYEDDSFNLFLETVKLTSVEKIKSSDECIGFICLGEKLNKSPYSEDDREFLKTILNISATAIQNSLVVEKMKNINRSLDSKVQKLNSLFELSKEFGTLNERNKVAKLLVFSVIGQFMVSKFAVVIYNNNHPEILESKFNNDDLLEVLRDTDISEIASPLSKTEILESHKDFDNLSIELVVPMKIHGKTRGAIFLGRRITNIDYSKDDIDFISSVGSLAIIALENQRLFIEALEKQKMEEELEIARDIQRNLLPQTIPQFKKFEVAAENISSKQVGGDYYDVNVLDENSFCVLIADVVGKGVPAALLMANIQAFLKVICKQGMSIKEATGLINDLITENITDGKFITFFWAVFNEQNMSMEYVNAGHNPPLLIRNGEIIRLNKGGMILGVMKTILPYESETINLLKDDIIILFTDGISEAKNIMDEEFSDERLEELVLKQGDKNADQILSTIQEDVQKFSYGASQSDDLTLMVVKVK